MQIHLIILYMILFVLLNLKIHENMIMILNKEELFEFLYFFYFEVLILIFLHI